jgi:ribonuclease P protein component
MDNHFPKSEKLCSDTKFQVIFSKGNSFLVFPFRVSFISEEYTQGSPVQIAFGVPRRTFKRAVKRNYIKRRMRECWRLQKEPLLMLAGEKKLQLSVFATYLAKDYTDFNIMFTKMGMAIGRIMAELEKGDRADKQAKS